MMVAARKVDREDASAKRRGHIDLVRKDLVPS
jgi:hypothetical protein